MLTMLAIAASLCAPRARAEGSLNSALPLVDPVGAGEGVAGAFGVVCDAGAGAAGGAGVLVDAAAGVEGAFVAEDDAAGVVLGFII